MSENTPEPTLIARFMNGLDSKQISDFTVIVRDNPSITDIEAMAQAVLALRAVTERAAWVAARRLEDLRNPMTEVGR